MNQKEAEAKATEMLASEQYDKAAVSPDPSNIHGGTFIIQYRTKDGTEGETK